MEDRTMQLPRRGVLCVLFVLLAGTAALGQAQITTGVIEGVVTDESGGVVPGASVRVVNVGTNLERNFITGDDGRFLAPQLPSGRYNVEVTMEGFANLRQEDVQLTVGKVISLDLQLKVSSVDETVVVTGTPLLDTAKIESSTTLDSATIESTPVLGRKFEDLLTLTPGVSIVQGPDGDEINFNGQRGIFNNISLDGGDYNNGFFGEQVGGQRAAVDITMEAVQEFQVIATGANAEFGRSAGGIVNVVTKSGTNEVHGSLFHFQRLESLSANTSDGRPLTDFHREQFGGTIGGPIQRDKMFYFFAFEQITGNLTRDNLSAVVGDTPCPTASPNLMDNQDLIGSNADCQRLALIDFFQQSRGQNEGAPVERPVNNSSLLAKYDWTISDTNNLSASYNYTRSKKENETFDVPTYGNSANGTEGPGEIQTAHLNWFSSITPTALNEFHFTYSRENRPRSATESNVPADTAIGFETTFRFGNPFFLQPDIDELFWRTQLRDNFTLIRGDHTIKLGGEWLHSLNEQVFRGFFTGRYIFGDVVGFLRYASPADMGPGFGPDVEACADGSFTDLSIGCPDGVGSFGSPLLLYLQGAGVRGPTSDATGFSNITNEDLAFFIQDKWQLHPTFTLNLGLRYEAQLFPEVVVPPSQTAYGNLLGDPRFPSDGTIPDETSMWQPRIGFAWDVGGTRKSVWRASAGVFNARQNMLTQVGSITTNGEQQQTIAGGAFANPTIRPTWPFTVEPDPLPPGEFPLFTGVRIFAEDYRNPRIYTVNTSFEQQFAQDWVAYVDFTWSKGVYLTRFLNINNGSAPTALPENGDVVTYLGPNPFGPQLGEVALTSSSAKSLYRGVVVGMRKRFSNDFSMEWNYTYARDYDDDSNERDPFTFRAFNRFNLDADYALSDRDIAHKFNLVLSALLPGGIDFSSRVQGRSAQPITTNPAGNGSGPPCNPQNIRTRVVDGIDCGRNTLRKDNEFFSWDWRIQRPFRWGDGRYALIPLVEMFNTFNNDNNINPLTTPGLFNFDGFLRAGVGDPRQVQLGLKFTF
ncbi:MAG TPA: TonB-dependent receptor [Acidobacteriota bacterium]|nr:TonB-dependent receptor [Acidobacteriota bacterium]